MISAHALRSHQAPIWLIDCRWWQALHPVLTRCWRWLLKAWRGGFRAQGPRAWSCLCQKHNYGRRQQTQYLRPRRRLPPWRCKFHRCRISNAVCTFDFISDVMQIERWAYTYVCCVFCTNIRAHQHFVRKGVLKILAELSSSACVAATYELFRH